MSGVIVPPISEIADASIAFTISSVSNAIRIDVAGRLYANMRLCRTQQLCLRVDPLFSAGLIVRGVAKAIITSFYRISRSWKLQRTGNSCREACAPEIRKDLIFL